MADKQARTNNAIVRTQERWQELENGIEGHAKLLTQLSQIAEKFQAVDSVFSDFKQTQSEIRSLKEQLPKYSKDLTTLQKIVASIQQQHSEIYRSSETIKLRCDTLNKSITENHRALESIRGDWASLRSARSHMKQVRTLALIAIFLGLASLAFSILNFIQN